MNEEEIQNLKNQITELQQELQQAQLKLSDIQQKINAIEEPGTATNFERYTKPQVSRKKSGESYSLENFIGLKIIHLVGIVVLLIGISIGVKYAIDKNLVTPLTRILLAYAASGGLFILSLILKKNYNAFSAILFSGAMVSAYFTSYGAFVYYNLIPETIAFILMIAFATFATLRSLQYNLQEIAILATVGAYAIPLLISANHENFLLLFSYILLMNVGVLYVSFKRSWKLLNLLALIVTWTFFITWVYLKYKPHNKTFALIFLVVYYILFLISIFAFTLSKKIKLNDRQLLQLFLNNTAFYISLLGIFDAVNSDANAAMVTACCALLFLLFALAGNKFFSYDNALNKLHYAYALVLITLFVPIEFSGLTITMLWLLIAIIVFTLGIITKATWPRLASIILLGFTLLKLLVVDSLSFTAIQKIIAYISLGTLLLILSFFYQKFKQILFDDATEK